MLLLLLNQVREIENGHSKVRIRTLIDRHMLLLLLMVMLLNGVIPSD